ncbi:sulfur carrier protein ThiS [Planktotalea sp.]|uniref:sulfur carrier protein ThiS n=1 Tax=Planktotalea sp. TaxID=2029877 RepID=UPI003D6A47B3
MKIIVNGEPIESNAATLEALLMELGKADAKVATAVNEGFVPVGLRAQTNLKNGDRVELVAPRQGG